MASQEVEITYPSVDAAECPFPQYAWLRAEAPVYNVPGTETYLVSRREDIVEITRNPEIFSSDARRSRTPFDSFGDVRPTVRGLHELDPPQHLPRRDACRKSLTPGRLKGYEPMIRSVADSLIDAFVERGRVDLVAEFATPFPMRVMMNLFGFVESDREWIEPWALVETSGSIFISKEMAEVQRGYAVTAGRRFLEELQARYDAPGDDILSEIITRNVERAGTFEVEKVRADAANIFRGGMITVAHAIPSAMLLLLEHPAELARARADPSGITRMFEEALRLESPSQWSPRVVRRDTKLGETEIPEGSYVLILWASGNRDEAVFDEPGHFDPGRANLTDHIAFGDRTHFCVGAPLARLEAQVAFEQLLGRLPGIRLLPNQDLLHAPSPKFRGLRSLELEFDAPRP